MYSTLKLAYSVSRFASSFFLDLFGFFLICVVLLAKLSYFHVDKINVREYQMDNKKKWQSRETGNTGYGTQDEEKQSKAQ